jgi:hypothetical protein
MTRQKTRTLLLALLLPLLSVFITSFASQSSAAVAPGTWSVVGNCSVNGYKVNAIHASVTKTGKVLLTAGSGYNRSYFEQKIYKAWLWNPATPSTCPKEIQMPDKDLFCSGHSHLPDGRVLFFGGNSRYGDVGSSPGNGSNYYGGIRESYVFDDATETFIFTGMMNMARWYPNGPVNAAGNPVVVGGIDENSQYVSTNEIYSATTNTWSVLPGQRLFPMYAGMTLRKNGTLCYMGTYFLTRAGASPQCWNWTNNTSIPITGLQFPDCRDQASGLMLPPAQNQRYMVIGGGCASGTTGTTAITDLDAANPTFSPGPYLGYAAMHTCAEILSDWSVFVSGGGNHNTAPQLQARRLAYGGTAFETMTSPTVPRLYHSTCLLLQDGTVVTMGTNGNDGSVEARFEVYKPWYAQPGVVRPTMASAPTTVQLGSSYDISYTGPATIKWAALTRLSSATHSSDPNKRLVSLGVTQLSSTKVRLKIESNWGYLPLGVYMLTIKDSRGVPSKSLMVRVVQAPSSPQTTQIQTTDAIHEHH